MTRFIRTAVLGAATLVVLSEALTQERYERKLGQTAAFGGRVVMRQARSRVDTENADDVC